ncbi:hypothetical protein L1987_14094 [Smallanthus sonchifolius]|uniref:Uncharacterized protein n=1 Tax=Smallanthus sonchifolius TaxID=185202 RepID=A0ACB9J2C5_9ASTR|nr:hypothetical protein L1987_14094 [Smallanthus sonchifolius]
MSAHHQTIQHIVLLNVKPDADSTKVATMMDGINGLASQSISLPENSSHLHLPHATSVTSLTAVSVQRMICTPTTIIQSTCVLQKIESLKPGCVMRVTLLKFNYDLIEDDKDKFVEVIEGVKRQFKTTQRLSLGENFSHEMAKGHSIAMIAVFPDLESFDSDSELANLHKSKVSDFLESTVVVDYVVPSAKNNDNLSINYPFV